MRSAARTHTMYDIWVTILNSWISAFHLGTFEFGHYALFPLFYKINEAVFFPLINWNHLANQSYTLEFVHMLISTQTSKWFFSLSVH